MQPLDEMTIQRGAVDSALYDIVNGTVTDSPTETFQESKTNSLSRNAEEWQHSALQHWESSPSVLAARTENIIYGSDQKIHRGPPGPVGPPGRRVSIPFGWK